MKYVKLGSVCKVVSGSTPKSKVPEYWDGDIKWITPAELSDDSFIINDSQRHISEKAVADTHLKSFPKGTVLLSSRAPIGKTAIAGCEMYCNQGFKNLICSEYIDPKYLYFFLSSKTEYLNSLGRGATFKELSKSIVENIEIPLPSKMDQGQIAKTLELIKKLEELYFKQISECDNLVKSRFIEMFGDPVKNTMRWEVVTFSEIFRMIKSGLSRKLSDDDIGLPMIRSKNIVKGVLDPSDLKYWHINDPQGADTNEYILDDGDILVNFINSSSQIGKGCIFHDIGRPCIYTTNCFRIKLKSDCNEIYFNSYMMTEGYYRQIQSIIQLAVNQASFTTKNYLQLKIPLPPLSLQNQFADFVAQVDKSKLAIQKSLDQLETLKKSLMQDYFG